MKKRIRFSPPRASLLRITTALVSAISLVLFATGAAAEESQFGFVYTTDLLPKGAKEVEQWVTWRHKKAGGKFDLVEARTEVEYGLTDRFQIAGYANYAWSRADHNGVDGSTVPPETFAFAQVDPNGPWRTHKLMGFSLEGIYRVMSPYTDPFGLALYLEPTIGHGLRELESRIIVQKNFLDDRLIFAANLMVEQEGRWLPADPTADPTAIEANGHWDHETDINVGVAASYRFAPNWSAGVEMQQEREYSSYKIRKEFRTNLGNYAGPTVHYGGKDFFITATYLVQLGGAKDYANQAPGFIVGGRSYADDFEKQRLRVKVGFYF